MALSASDHNDLVLTLFEGLFAPTPWDTFLHRLLARTRAERIVLQAGMGGAARRVAGRGWADPAGEAEERAALAALGERGLRANRVYALEELLDFDDPVRRARQDALLGAARIGDTRLIRVGAGDGPAVLVALLHERAAFGATESALLTALAPAIGIAAANLAAIALQKLRLTAAEDTLALLGIGQAVLDRNGQALSADPLWQAHAPGAAALAEALKATDGETARRPVRVEDAGPLVLLRATSPGATGAAAIGTLRIAATPEPLAAARVIAAELGLSPREAALAARLASGHSLVEAGRALHLTAETARNYSKRIYAKTGAAGQADLVRLVLQGLGGLA